MSDESLERTLSGQLYLVMSDGQALREMLSFWNMYKDDPTAKLPHGLGRWKQVFSQLRTIRPWDVQDRLGETGLLNEWKDRLQNGERLVPFEAELWFRKSETLRAQAEERVRQAVTAVGGRVLRRSVIAEIGYHAILGEVPAQPAEAIVRHPETELVRVNPVMFFRPVGQSLAARPTGEDARVAPRQQPVTDPRARVAVLDGLPISNHRYLTGRVAVDDPDGWGSTEPPDYRTHGTEVASLVTHGDLSVQDTSLRSPVYCRPILRTDPRTWEVKVPDDELVLDLLHRAVRRIKEGEGDEVAVAPEVRVINLSIGDRWQPFDRRISALARLIDWLSWTYGILFIVSAGNCFDDLELSVPRDDLQGMSRQDVESAVIRALGGRRAYRRIISPAEAANALTVGAAHQDGSPAAISTSWVDPVAERTLIAPYTRLGGGLHRSVKPDVLVPGGRRGYQRKMGTSHAMEVLQTVEYPGPPGLAAASAGDTPGVTTAIAQKRATSFAAAGCSHLAGRVLEHLDDLRRQGAQIEEPYDAVMTKALLVHAADWQKAGERLADIFGWQNRDMLSKGAAPLLGYGCVRAERLFGGDSQRAVLLGTGQLEDGEGDLFSIPLPPSLSGERVWRRLTLTLAWITNVNPSHHRYRRAMLWFEPPQQTLRVARRQADWQATRRGTVQHEILEGEEASMYLEDEQLNVQVNCRADAGRLEDAVRYALVVSIEVAPETGLPIHDEVRARIRQPSRVRPIVRVTGRS